MVYGSPQVFRSLKNKHKWCTSTLACVEILCCWYPLFIGVCDPPPPPVQTLVGKQRISGTSHSTLGVRRRTL